MKVRLYSHVGQITGYGRAGVELAQCLLRVPGITQLEISAGTSVGERTLPVAPAVAACIRPERDLDPRPDLVIIHTLPRSCLQTLENIYNSLVSAEHLPMFVAYTTWETFQAPEDLVKQLITFDQVWVPSQVTAEAFRLAYPAISSQLRVVPHAFDETTFEARQRVDRGDDVYRFYYVGAWTQRKNPAGVIRAFCHAFGREDPVELLIHSPGAEVDDLVYAMGSTGIDQSIAPRVKPRRDPVSDDAIIDLHRQGDCFVTASRGEAWNLPAFDAYLAGNQLIVPADQGSDEYILQTNALRIGGRITPATVDVRKVRTDGNQFAIEIRSPDGVNGKTLWRDPDLVQLAHSMRMMATRRPPLITRPHPPGLFGYTPVAQIVSTHLTELLTS